MAQNHSNRTQQKVETLTLKHQDLQATLVIAALLLSMFEAARQRQVKSGQSLDFGSCPSSKKRAVPVPRPSHLQELGWLGAGPQPKMLWGPTCKRATLSAGAEHMASKISKSSGESFAEWASSLLHVVADETCRTVLVWLGKQLMGSTRSTLGSYSRCKVQTC